jgi:hypothetical protein
LLFQQEKGPEGHFNEWFSFSIKVNFFIFKCLFLEYFGIYKRTSITYHFSFILNWWVFFFPLLSKFMKLVLLLKMICSCKNIIRNHENKRKEQCPMIIKCRVKSWILSVLLVLYYRIQTTRDFNLAIKYAEINDVVIISRHQENDIVIALLH